MGEPEAGRRRWKQWLGYGAGGVLLVLALGFAVSGIDMAALRSAPPWAFGLLAGLVGANYVFTGLMFWNITLSFDAQPRVGIGRMLGLITASGLLNYIPMIRAGTWGRTVYLKQRHGLPVRQSVTILAIVLALTVAVVGGGGAILLLFPPAVRWGVVLGGLVLLTSLTPVVAPRCLRRPVIAGWGWLPWRTLDFAAAAGRLWLGMLIVGQPVDVADVVVLTSASLLVKIAGLTPNGLGLSEWVVAALSAAVTPIEASVAAAAALVDRAAEVLVTVVLGGLALVGLRQPQPTSA